MTQEDCAVQRAIRYVHAGMSPEAAIERACQECFAQGLGQIIPTSLYSTIEAPVAAASAAVSPWLWILSVGGFLLGVWDKYQIGKMYGSYKRMKQRLS